MELTPKWQFLGLTFDVTVMIGTVVTMILVILLVLFATRRRDMVPRGIQNVMEMIIEFVQGVTKIMLSDKEAEKYLTFAITTFLFVFIANELGIVVMITADASTPIPWLGISADQFTGSGPVAISWFKSPTSDINVTVAMAFAITIYAHFAGFFKSPKGYFSHYVQPYSWMLPLHIIDEIAKPTTHAARLWANIFAGEVLILILREGLVYLTAVPLVVWIGFSLFVGAIQAYIFTVLAMVYISQKVADDH